MTSLQLIPGLHRQQLIDKVIFTYNKDLIALVKQKRGARWSQTLRSWYFLKEEFQLNPFYNALKDIFLILKKT